MSATVNSMLAKIARIVDPYANDSGQEIQDISAAVTISGAVSGTGGIIKISAANHGLKANDRVFISGVLGTVEANSTLANPYWVVATTGLATNTLELVGSTFTNVWSSGGTQIAVGAMVGAVGGALAPQRLLDIYNFTRLAIGLVIEQTFPRHLKVLAIAGNVLKEDNLTFTTGVAPKPAGLIEVIRCEDVNGDQITLLPTDEIENIKDLESATNRFAFDYGTNWSTLTGATNVPNGSDYVLYYRAIVPFTLSDVVGGSVVETYADIFHPFLIEQAVKVYKAQGSIDTEALTEALKVQMKAMV